MEIDSRARMNASGRVVIPVEVRRALGLRDGDELVFHVSGNELTVTTMKSRIAQAQRIVQTHIKRGTSLVDELIKERRAEARKELK